MIGSGNKGAGTAGGIDPATFNRASNGCIGRSSDSVDCTEGEVVNIVAAMVAGVSGGEDVAEGDVMTVSRIG